MESVFGKNNEEESWEIWKMADVKALKGTKILVNVEEALLDVIVVAFHYGKQVFHGALLDVGKKNCPFGIDPTQLLPGEKPDLVAKRASSHDGHRKGSTKTEEAEDPYHALKQRFTYFQQQTTALYAPLHLHSSSLIVGKNGRRAPGRGGARDQGVRMRRLRPRQVLCSQCRSICNENSDNVQNINTKNKKNEESLDASKKAESEDTSYPKRDLHPLDFRSKRQTNVSSRQKNVEEYRLRSAGGVPGRMILRKRKPNDDDEDDDFVVRECKMATRAHPVIQELPRPEPRAEIQPKREEEEEPETTDGDVDPSSTNEDANRTSTSEAENVGTNQRRPVIKISFANPQGHDTVVEIPARPSQHADSDASAKAAKKALKKAKKEAQRKASSLSGAVPGPAPLQSPPPPPTQLSQQYSVLVPTTYSYPGSSPSPLSEATSNSPSMCVNNAQVVSAPPPNPLRRHKHHKHHKVKRKRRRRTFSDESSSGNGNSYDGSQQDENRLIDDDWGMVKTTAFTVADIRPSDGLYEEVRNNCLRQKLSISLKRLSARAYARCSPKQRRSPGHYPEREENAVYDLADSPSEDTDAEEVPDFPKHEPPALRSKDGSHTAVTLTSATTTTSGAKQTKLMMRITTHSVSHCALEGGREMVVGDIVWGKIHGFPWWPGKVLALSVSQRDNGMTISQQAHVAWFGSSTSSLMPCQQLSPFLLDFKTRYNRKKRGPYKEAIRQATLEAQQVKMKQTLHTSVTSTTSNDESALSNVSSSTSGSLLFVSSGQERPLSIKNNLAPAATAGPNISLVT